MASASQAPRGGDGGDAAYLAVAREQEVAGLKEIMNERRARLRPPAPTRLEAFLSRMLARKSPPLVRGKIAAAPSRSANPQSWDAIGVASAAP